MRNYFGRLLAILHAAMLKEFRAEPVLVVVAERVARQCRWERGLEGNGHQHCGLEAEFTFLKLAPALIWGDSRPYGIQWLDPRR